MKALRFDRTGTLNALTMTDVPIPTAGGGEVRVRVHAASLNPSDVANVRGRFPYTTTPRTPGRDFAGTVVDGPEDMVGLQVWGSGRELGFTRDGTHAEYLTIPGDGVTPKPQNLTFAEAASAPVPYLTAREALDRAAVGPDTRLAIIGHGAVGRAALALATARGAPATVAVRRDAQATELRDAGVHAVTLDDGDFAADVRRHLDGDADVVFDATGHQLPAAVGALAPGGRVCVIAAPPDGHERVPIRDLYRRGASIIGVNSLLHDTVATAGTLDTLRLSFEQGELPRPDNLALKPLDDAVSVYRTVAAGTREKFVLTP